MAQQNTIATEAGLLPTPQAGAIIPEKQRVFLLVARQALIMMLGALEDYLGLDRSIVPKHKRVSA